jgi:hypothetical protein
MISSLWKGRIAATAAALLLAALLAGAAGWWIRREKQKKSVLFNRLPAENLLLLYVDLENLRRAAALAPLVRERVDPDPDYAAFVKQTGFDYQRDLDAASVCYLPDRVYLLARGRFDEAKLRRYALSQGGTCAAGGLSRPCRMPASRPGRTISFYLISRGVLALATAPEPEAVLQLENTPVPSAASLAEAANELGGSRALLWATATPAGLEGVLTGAAVSPNLILFSRALAGAQRAYLFVADRSPNLEIALRAICGSDAQAAELQHLLYGLNEITRSLMGRTQPGGSNPWNGILASAAITQQQNKVQAMWTLDRAILESLGAPDSRDPTSGGNR